MRNEFFRETAAPRLVAFRGGACRLGARAVRGWLIDGEPRPEFAECLDLDQTYLRMPGAGVRFDYDSPRHGYHATLRFAPDGLVVDYPFIGRRRT